MNLLEFNPRVVNPNLFQLQQKGGNVPVYDIFV
jgi:hypothetical protein